jgi:hypothetical protein
VVVFVGQGRVTTDERRLISNALVLHCGDVRWRESNLIMVVKVVVRNGDIV